jgi:NitT/TauT family transport system ATP-binding protein
VAFLGDRVVVMSPRPGRVSAVLDVPFSHPRTLDLMFSPDFAEFSGDIRRRLETGHV